MKTSKTRKVSTPGQKVRGSKTRGMENADKVRNPAVRMSGDGPRKLRQTGRKR